MASSDGKLKASLADLETKGQQLNTNEQNFEQLNSEIKTQSENYQRELLEITRVKEELESSLEREVKQRTELETRNEQLTASFEEKQRESDDVREKLKSKEEAIENLTHDMEVTRTSHLNKEAQLTSANDHIQALSTQMGAMEEAHKIEVERLEIETRERLDQLGSAGEEIIVFLLVGSLITSNWCPGLTCSSSWWTIATRSPTMPSHVESSIFTQSSRRVWNDFTQRTRFVNAFPGSE